MTQVVNVPGVGQLNFPDGMSQPEMAAAIQKNFPQIHGQPQAAANPTDGIGALASGFIHPGIPMALAGGAAAYSKPVQSILNAVISSRPPTAAPVGNFISKYAAALGNSNIALTLGAGNVTNNQQKMNQAMADIGGASTVDEAIAAAGAAVNASQAAHQVTEAMPAPVPAQPVAPEPEPVPVSMALPPVDGVASKEPMSTWYGRRGDGYEAVGDAQMAMRSRQKAAPEMDWRVETMPSGRYRLAGYQSNQNGSVAGKGAANASFASFDSTPKSDGTLAIKGDARSIIQTLLASGVPAASLMPVNGGVLVGRSQAGRVQEAIDQARTSEVPSQ